MTSIQSLFPTLLYRTELAGKSRLNRDLETAALSLSRDDRAGLKWSERYGYPGYTSYASLDDLPWRFPVFAELVKVIDRHALAFCKALHWNLRGGKPKCDSLWVNVMPEGGSHTSHLHPHSVISGTYYVAVPQGSGPIVFEDPRLPMLMAAPSRKANAPREVRTHISETPSPGTLLLWESWLRHEVPLNRADGLRISVSFNYVIG
jgi:uncharacterized protein (TIGR02466 family)